MNANALTRESDRLVCGVDDSEQAFAVAAIAAQLAELLGLRLCLVHSADPDLFLVGHPRDAALHRGESLLDRVGPDGGPHERIVELGDPATLIRAVANEGAAMVVVGSRGRGPLRAALLGSTSRALTEHAPCPVVVVPAGVDAGWNRPPTVVCGLDASDDAFAALATATGLARVLRTRLVGVHVRTPARLPVGNALPLTAWPPVEWVNVSNAAIDAIERALADIGLDVASSLRVDDGDPVRELEAVAAGEPAALLVVGSRGFGALRSAMLGSVSAALSATAPVPVVVVPRPVAEASLDTPHGYDVSRTEAALA